MSNDSATGMTQRDRPMGAPAHGITPAINRSGWMAVLVLSGCVSLLGTGCSRQPAAPPVVVQVQDATVTLQSISQHVTGDAILAPIAQAAISPKISAPVRKFYVMRGSKVRRGELLAVLDNADLAAAALDSQGNYEQAQATYNTSVKASIPEMYQKATLDTDQTKANLDVAQRVYDSRSSLFQQGAIPRQELETARASLVQAQSAYDIARTHLASAKAVSRADAMKAAAGQLASAKGKYEAAEAMLHYSEIRSPINGVVTERPLFAGETAPAGTPLITVMDVATLRAKMHVPEDQARLLKVGQPASVQVDGMNRPVVGTVSLVSPALDPGSTTIEIWIDVPNKDGILKAGAQVHVSITSQTIAEALVIPKEAVVTNSAGKQIAMVIDSNDVAHQRQLETGIADGNRIQVIHGLRAGEKVVTSGAYAMDDGTKVAILPPNDAADEDQNPQKTGNR